MPNIPPASPNSPLVGFSLPDGASRVYYFNPQNHIIELAWVGHWVSNDLTEIATPH